MQRLQGIPTLLLLPTSRGFLESTKLGADDFQDLVGTPDVSARASSTPRGTLSRNSPTTWDAVFRAIAHDLASFRIRSVITRSLRRTSSMYMASRSSR